MIINDKALARALKRSGKAGFKFCVNGNAIRLVSWDWAARLPLQSSGTENRQTLAALVEMLGYLPGDGECGHVYRDGGEWYDQDMTEAVFDIEFNQLARSENSDELCCVLPVQYGFRPLIYTQRGLMYRISGPQELCAAMTGTRRFFREPATLGFCDHESVLYLSCLRPEIPGEIWAQLEKIDWGTGNDDGQEDD